MTAISTAVPYKGQRPVRAYDEPAGSDLRLAKGITIEPGQTVLAPTGTALSAPSGTFAMLALRSSMPRRGISIPNGIGVIDPDYTGTIFVWLHNFTNEPVILNEGERIAQVIFVPYVVPNFYEVEDLKETKRGNGGFGSSGTGE